MNTHTISVPDLSLNNSYPHICAEWVNYLIDTISNFKISVLRNKIENLKTQDHFEKGLDAFDALKELYFSSRVNLENVVRMVKCCHQEEFIGFQKLNFGKSNSLNERSLKKELKKVEEDLKFFVREYKRPERRCEVIKCGYEGIHEIKHFVCLNFFQNKEELSVNCLKKYKEVVSKLLFDDPKYKIGKRYSFIFKTEGHISTSHYDLEKPPYAFISSQISGESRWRFYASFLGEYLNYLSNAKSERVVKKVIGVIESKYSSLYKDVTVKAGEFILVLPDSTHEVMTPSCGEKVISAACAVEIDLPQWRDFFKFKDTDAFIEQFLLESEEDDPFYNFSNVKLTPEELDDVYSQMTRGTYFDESTKYEKNSVAETDSTSAYLSASKHNKKINTLKEILNFADDNKNFRVMLKDLYDVYKRNHNTFVEYKKFDTFFKESVRIHYTFGETTLASANKDLREGRVSAVAKNVIKNIGKRKKVSPELNEAAEELIIKS